MTLHFYHSLFLGEISYIYRRFNSIVLTFKFKEDTAIPRETIF